MDRQVSKPLLEACPSSAEIAAAAAEASRALSKFRLAFEDPNLEDAYLTRMYRENRKWLIGVVIMAVVLLVAMAPLDFVYIQENQRRAFLLIRFAAWLPALLIAFPVLLFAKDVHVTMRCFVALGFFSGICLAGFSLIGGTPVIEYVAALTVQLLLFVYFLSGLPFRWAASIAAVTHIAQFIAILASNPHVGKLSFFIATVVVTCATLGLAAYRFEKISRQNFLAQHQLQHEYQRRLSTERNRVRWLETVAGFLRHELKNAMTGIGSSLALAEASAIYADTARYLERAKKSLDFMRRFLGQAAEATSLESALAEQEMEPVDLSQLVAGRVRDYAEEFPDRKFCGSVDREVEVLGNADRLVQLLDKLVNNAVEHGDIAHPIEVELLVQQTVVTLSVRNRGDALPCDLDAMFAPLVSTKLERGSGNLGLGLFVARSIAIRHGGTIRAERLSDPVGAELRVELPRLVR